MDFVRVPVCYTLHWFTAGTLPNCCDHPKESFYASLCPLFLFPRKPYFKHTKIFSDKVKGRRFQFLIASAFQIIFFLFVGFHLLNGLLQVYQYLPFLDSENSVRK